jgi:CrcB protein
MADLQPGSAFPAAVDSAVDYDVHTGADLHQADQRRERRRADLPLVLAISGGGVGGALARYSVGILLPHRADGFPWATFWVNVSGCLLMGVLMVAITEIWSPHRLLRPFLGTGLLGGFTTFSTYTSDGRLLLADGHPVQGLLYVACTVVAALSAVYVGLTLARRAARAHPATRSSLDGRRRS